MQDHPTRSGAEPWAFGAQRRKAVGWLFTRPLKAQPKPESLNQQVCSLTAMLFSAVAPRYRLRLLRDPLYMFLYMFGFINQVKSSADLPQIDELFPRSSPHQ